MASYVLKDNGVVFGAAFDENFNVKHIFVDKEADMYKLRGSKYLQSRTEDCYAQTKKFLNEGRKVLYSGTPCQIVGLYIYLGKDYDNLILVDIICHGVPSPLVWQKYLYIVKEDGKLQSVFFRDKTYGWKNYAVSVRYNQSQYLREHSKDNYIKAFIKDVCLRPSCYKCPAKDIARSSDLTIADFWGIEKVLPEMDDDKGTSLVIIHSRKGEGIFSEISNDINYRQVDFNEAIRYNPAMLRSARKPDNRNKFMRAIISGKDFDESVNKYCCPSIKERIIKFIKRVLRKIRHVLLHK